MTDTGFRFWRVEDHQLVAPFAYDTLPSDGLVVAQCAAHDAPGLWCGCGIAVYLSAREAVMASQWLYPEPFAITAGTITGPVRAEVHMQPYQVGNRWVTIPTGRRVAAYQVTAIYTDASVDHDIPVHPLAECQ